jgi:hypothetical protein
LELVQGIKYNYCHLKQSDSRIFHPGVSFRGHITISGIEKEAFWTNLKIHPPCTL